MAEAVKKWYEKAGKDADVVVSTRVRLARNLDSLPFPARMTAEQKKQVEDKVRDALLNSYSAIAPSFTFVDLKSLPREKAISLAEQHIISPEFVTGGAGCGLLISADEQISIMLNEEDHIRIQIMKEGFALEETAELADRIDTLLNESLRYAFDDELGYLTQCPTNIGTGMRASVMLHLPVLTESGSMTRISAHLSKLGLAIRGTFGEGSGVTGALYQLSNQITLGLSEKEAIANLQNIAQQLIAEERKARATLVREMTVQDQIGRSMGILKGARILSCEEYMKLISYVRLGIASELFHGVTMEEINALTAAVQPATLSVQSGTNVSARQRDVLRAEKVRSVLQKIQ